jgi:hypothetical protein
MPKISLQISPSNHLFADSFKSLNATSSLAARRREVSHSTMCCNTWKSKSTSRKKKEFDHEPQMAAGNIRTSPPRRVRITLN